VDTALQRRGTEPKALQIACRPSNRHDAKPPVQYDRSAAEKKAAPGGVRSAEQPCVHYI